MQPLVPSICRVNLSHVDGGSEVVKWGIKWNIFALFSFQKCVSVVGVKHPEEENESGRSRNVIHKQDRAGWAAWGCAWESHWEETPVSVLCLQTSIQSFLLFQEKLQAFTAPYWRDHGGQLAICLFHSLYSPWSWWLCFRLFAALPP